MPTDKISNQMLICGSLPPEIEYDADIIILTMGRFEQTFDAVNSALRQKKVNIHVALFDQGSIQTTIDKWLELFGNYKNFCFFSSQINLGVGAGRNFLSSVGHGKIIVALDNDAVFANDYIVANALKTFDNNFSLGATSFKILSGNGIELDDFSWGYPISLKKQANNKFLTTTFVGAGHAIRRTTWNEVGGYDTKLFFTWEEYDFCLRAILDGWLIQYDGDLAVLHMVSSESRVTWSSRRTKFYIRNRLIIARKWNHSWFRLLPRILGYIVKGSLNNSLEATLSGIIETFQYDNCIQKRAMPSSMSNYIFEHEYRHRGSIIQRIKNEVLKKLPIES